MSTKHSETLEIIEKWLEEYDVFRFREIEDEDNAFTIEVLSKLNVNSQPIYVIGHKDEEDTILISWVLRLDDQTKETVRIIDIQIKRKFEVAMKTALQMRDVSFTVYESLEDMKSMYVEKELCFSQLSKEKLYAQIIDLKFSMTFVERKFIEFFDVPPEFDPSSNV